MGQLEELGRCYHCSLSNLQVDSKGSLDCVYVMVHPFQMGCKFGGLCSLHKIPIDHSCYAWQPFHTLNVAFIIGLHKYGQWLSV